MLTIDISQPGGITLGRGSACQCRVSVQSSRSTSALLSGKPISPENNTASERVASLPHCTMGSAVWSRRVSVLTLMVSPLDVVAGRDESEIKKPFHDMVPREGARGLDMPILSKHNTIPAVNYAKNTTHVETMFGGEHQAE